MEQDKIKYGADLKHIAEAANNLLKSADGDAEREGHHHGSSVRESTHNGRKIRIETTYRITVDGAPVLGHVMVGNDGRVHYHSIPNQEFASAVNMVKRIIDLVPSGYSASGEV